MNSSNFSQQRRGLLTVGGASVLGLGWPAQAQVPVRKRLLLSGPLANVSFPLMRLVDSGALAELAHQVEFRAWSNPDQLRALVVGGEADFVAAPTNVAANLYNRGVPLRLLDVSVWGILWLVSRNGEWQTLADFRGEEIVLPFRADMPDIVFQLLAERQGLDLQEDFRIRYVASPLDAMQLLVSRRADHALLAEPAVSMALRKTQSFPVSVIAPELFRSVDLQREWGRVLERAPRIPQAGIAAVGAAVTDAALLEKIQQLLPQAHAWCWANPQECGLMVKKYADMLLPEAVADSLRAVPAYYRTAGQAREELEYFYSLLHEKNAALVGGKLPDGGFYG